jgi:hypothetical protein
MKQGNGTEILGPNDPRAASIGIIHVSPTDERKNVLAAIITQEKFGRKQVAVVLPPQNRAFQRPADFDDLKSMRNRLKTEVVFIAPSGPGPGEFARQRRFPVYSSLQSYAQALHEESSIEAAPKKGLFGGPKPRAADLPPPPPAPVMPAAEQTEQEGTGYPAAPFVGELVAGGVGALAADRLLHPDHNAGSVSPVPLGAEDDYQFAPDASVPPAAPRSPLPPLARVPNASPGSSSPRPASSEVTPKQPRITSDLTKSSPAAPMPPLQPAPVSRATRQPNSGKMDALGAGIVGAAGGRVAGRAAPSGGAPPLIHRTHSGAKRSGGSRGRRRLGWLIVLALLLLSLLLCSGVAFALPKQTQAVILNLTKMVSNPVNPQTSSSSPMLTITPASQVVQNPYSIQAVTTGASATQHQVTARLLTANPSQQKTVTATGHVKANPAPAKGVVTFTNGSNTPYTYGTTTAIVGNGVTFYLDAPVTIPPANPGVSFGTATGTVTAATPGSNGNIGPGVINIQGQFITIKNEAAFTGGQDAKDYHFLQQSDFDNVAGPLKTTVLSQAKSGTQSQIRSTERVARALQCTAPTATADQPIGDTGVNVTSATVTASASCSQEVYDQQGLQGLVEGLLKAKAGSDPKLAGYALVGSIITETKVQGVDNNNTVTLAVTAKGKWVYQVDKNAIARLIAGLSAQQASAKLGSQPGIANFSLASGLATFPSNPAQISIEVVNVPGFSGGGETATPVGPGTGTPSSGLTPQPGNG